VWAGVGTCGAADESKPISNGGLVHTLLAPAVTHEPYSANRVEKDVRTLADGSHINAQGKHFVARDSMGRVRIEKPILKQDGKVLKKMVVVLDPVKLTLTVWAEGCDCDKSALVINLPGDTPRKRQEDIEAMENGESVRRVNANRPQPVITTENLGTEMLLGVPVEMVKKTTTVPIGRSHNDAPIVKTEETWTSKELQLVVKQEWVDPRTGDRTVEFADFSRAEPDPALFKAPAGYKVKDLKQTLQEMQEKLSELQANM